MCMWIFLNNLLIVCWNRTTSYIHTYLDVCYYPNTSLQTQISTGDLKASKYLISCFCSWITSLFRIIFILSNLLVSQHYTLDSIPPRSTYSTKKQQNFGFSPFVIYASHIVCDTTPSMTNCHCQQTSLGFLNLQLRERGKKHMPSHY